MKYITLDCKYQRYAGCCFSILACISQFHSEYDPGAVAPDATFPRGVRRLPHQANMETRLVNRSEPTLTYRLSAFPAIPGTLDEYVPKIAVDRSKVLQIARVSQRIEIAGRLIR